MTTPHPAHMFTQEQATEFNRQVRANLEKIRASAVTPRPATQPDLPPITDWNEARQARIQFELMGDATAALESAHQEQFHLCQMIAELEAILADNPTDEEKRAILGWDEKVRPSLPGVLDTKVHIEGSLEKTKAKLAQVECELPLLENKAARYEQLRKQLEPWPTWRIDRLRNAENERRLIAHGKPVQRRPQ